VDYDPSEQEYTKAAAVSSTGTSDFRAQGVTIQSTTTKYLGLQTLSTSDGKHVCWVVEQTCSFKSADNLLISPLVVTTWIDRTLQIPLQSLTVAHTIFDGEAVTVRMKSAITHLKVNQPVSDSAFHFVPPSGAKHVDAFTTHGPVDLTGSTAAEFQLRGFDGGIYSLAALKGKVVLLDFWATWCGPCRRSMPETEELFTRYREQGLVVIGVDVNEDEPAIAAFLRKVRRSYPTAMSNSDILSAYHVTAYPTFVLIGHDGKILVHQIGFVEERLRSMVETAMSAGR